MRLILSGHLRQRLVLRGLGESDLEAVVRRKQKPGRDKHGNPIYRGMVRGIAVAVVIRKGSTAPFVITVFLDQGVMPMSTPRIEYDREADALYIYLNEDIPFDHMTTDLDRSCSVDYGPDNAPIGVEFWNVSSGVEVGDVPMRDTVLTLLEAQHIPVFA